MDLQARLRRLRPHRVEQLRHALAQRAVVLGSHQQVDAPQPALLGEQREHVPLPVHHRHRTDPVELGRQRRAGLQPPHPAVGLALLQRPTLVGLPVRRFVLDVRHPQRNALPVDHQRRVHVQPQRARRALVLADQPQADAAGVLGEVQIATVLQAQHCLLALHPLQRALPVRRQDVLRRDLRVGRLVDHAVVAPHRRQVPHGRPRERRHGLLRLHLRALHQPLAQAYITQLRAAELVLRPHVPREALARAQRRQRLRRRHAQLRAPVPGQRVQVDRFQRHARAARREASAPGGLARQHPVGGGQRGARVAVLFNKGLHQRRAIAVAALEVGGQAAQAQPERLGGEVLAAHARTDQKAAQSDHAMQLAGTQVGVPADEGVARRQRQRRGGEAQRAEDTVLGDQQVAQLRPHVPRRATRMLALHQLGPEAPLVVAGHLDQFQPLHLIDPRRHALRLRDRPSQTAGPAAAALVTRGRQLDAAVRVERTQRLHAAGQLGVAAPVMEAEQLAHASAELGPAGRADLRQQLLQPGRAAGTGERCRDLILLVHTQGMTQSKYKSQPLTCVSSAGCGCSREGSTMMAEGAGEVKREAVDAPDDLYPPADQANGTPEINGPKFVRYFGPVLDALRALGGSAEPQSAMDKVIKLAAVTDQELAETTKGGQSRFENQVGWARFYLSRAGLIDGKVRGRWVLTAEGIETHLDHKAALVLFRNVSSRFRDTSTDEDNPAPNPSQDVSSELFDDPERSVWFVGANWDGADQTERFLGEGIWTNGYDDKFADHVQRMKPGDLIAIKASFTKKYGLPFDNRDRPVSCMRIKATGTVTERTQDGQTVRVDWGPSLDPKEWYFYTYRVTIVEANVADELARRLIRFTFGNHRQDYEFWLRQPYWAKKYRGSPEAGADVQTDEEDAEPDSGELSIQPYDVSNILDDGCFLPETDIRDALDRLQSKKNLILQGPPGTGKTWLAKRLCYAIIGTRDRHIAGNRMRVIQFHPSLSYEDFVRGWRPDGNGDLKLIDGVFLEAIGAARAEPDLPFVVVIEEINRGNPAQTFGEMLTLLESDKRREDEAIELAYQSQAGAPERVFIPDNLHVIGTMNIADRSIALVDLALRRRFAFVTLATMLNERWERWCQEEADLDHDTISTVRRVMTELNDEIARDRSLGPQFRVGHSFVTPAKGEKIGDPEAWFKRIVAAEIAPLLEEYWYDNPELASAATKRLLGTFGSP